MTEGPDKDGGVRMSYLRGLQPQREIDRRRVRQLATGCQDFADVGL